MHVKVSGTSRPPLDPSGPGDAPGADEPMPNQPDPAAAAQPAAPRWTARRVAVALVAAVVVVFLVVKATEDLRQFAVVSLNGLTLAALFFVVASGFTLIFGLMRVVNMAHGSLYLFGGYLALEMQDSWFKEETGLGLSLSGETGAEYDLFGWVVPLILATLVIGVLGVIMQQVFLRWNQGQDLRQALITIALSVIFADQMLAAFGGISKDIKTPTDWPDSINLPGDVRFGFFRGVVVLGAAILIGLALWWLIKRTRFGKIVRAGVDDRDMVAALGINVQLVFAAAFFLGAMLAGLGGVLGGTMIALAPGEDTSFLLNSLIVVIIGGMGSLGGAAIGALALGLVDAYADVYLVFGDTDLTNYSILVTFALLVTVLAVRPLGLFGRPA
ncbi:MAG: branched-chain amino acid ABC transporter permease [Actinomycetota bacterium]|nr:branched-chain amino acid ABC transporter permease [Actinomycetota bacterium]